MPETFLLPDQSLLRDPLGETARRERRGLLAVSIIAVAVVKGHMVPARLVMADIELTIGNQQFIFSLLFWIVFYFLAAFILYAVSDYGLWGFDFTAARFAHREAVLEGLRQAIQTRGTDRASVADLPFLPSPSRFGGDIGPPPLPAEIAAQQRPETPNRDPSFFRMHRTRFAQAAFVLRLVIDLMMPLGISLYALYVLHY